MSPKQQDLSVGQFSGETLKTTRGVFFCCWVFFSSWFNHHMMNVCDASRLLIGSGACGHAVHVAFPGPGPVPRLLAWLTRSDLNTFGCVGASRQRSPSVRDTAANDVGIGHARRNKPNEQTNANPNGAVCSASNLD